MLQNVTHCPHNNDTLQERSWKKMCHTFPKCKGETLVYHCVKYKNNLVEVCAPKGLITGNFDALSCRCVCNRFACKHVNIELITNILLLGVTLILNDYLVVFCLFPSTFM